MSVTMGEIIQLEQPPQAFYDYVLEKHRVWEGGVKSEREFTRMSIHTITRTLGGAVASIDFTQAFLDYLEAAAGEVHREAAWQRERDLYEAVEFAMLRVEAASTRGAMLMAILRFYQSPDWARPFGVAGLAHRLCLSQDEPARRKGAAVRAVWDALGRRWPEGCER